MSVRAINWAMGLFKNVDLPPQERMILTVLCHHHHDKTSDCFPSYETIALLSGYRRRRVIQGVSNLKEWGLVKTQKRRVNGQQGSNQFVLFGTYKPATRVHKKAPCQSADGGTLYRVQTGAPDRGDISKGEAARSNVSPFRRVS